MKRILLNLAPYKHIVLIIFILLGVQAYCDLALPQYTSDMIDIGIQNHGIEYAVPEKLTSEDMAYSMLFMTENERSEWSLYYKHDNNGAYTRTVDKNNLKSISDKFLIPLSLVYQTGNMSEERFRATLAEYTENSPQSTNLENLSVEEIGKLLGTELRTSNKTDEKGKTTTYVDVRPVMLSLLQSGRLDSTKITAMRSQLENTVSSLGERTVKSMGIAYAAETDKAAGIDIDAIQKRYLWIQGLKMFLMAALMLAVSICTGYFAARTGAGIGKDLREKIFRRVMSYSNTEIDKFSTASLITRSTNDVQQIQMVTALLLRVLMYAPILGIGSIIKVIGSGAHMSWIIIAAVSIIFMLVLVLLIIAMPKFKAMQKLVDNLNLISREILTGLNVIRAFGREKEEEDRFEKANRSLMNTQLFTGRVMTFMLPGMMLVMYGVTLTIVWVSAHRIDAGTLQVGSMTAFITYSTQIVMSFLMLTVMSVMLPRAGVAADRIDEVLKTNTSLHDPDTPITPAKSSGTVCFENVSFRYPNADDNALDDITFTAEAGKTTAIIGSTGCGKTTLVNLIPRFYDVTSGRITLDGTDIRSFKMSDLRSRIGLVPQKGILFSGTIASNLRFGKKEATDEELRKAAEISQALEFITSDDNAFERSISQGGSNVSGGQKQRLAIARAIIKEPDVYIFDDSFSALDMRTDASLRKALSAYTRNSAVIIVAQRISTIMNADQIIVLESGRIVGKGTHKELMKRCDTYKQIAGSQLSEEELKKSVGGDEDE